MQMPWVYPILQYLSSKRILFLSEEILIQILIRVFDHKCNI